jgi:hypothetical protein
MPNNTFTPINRNNIFYSDKEFEYETDVLIDYIEGDLNQTIVIYPVDREKTQVNAITQNAVNGIRFKNPIEIPCQYEIADSELKTFDKKTSNGVYALSGNLTAYVMPKILEKYECEICKNIFPIPRKQASQRERDHIKDIYCPFCKKKTKHIKKGF